MIDSSHAIDAYAAWMRGPRRLAASTVAYRLIRLRALARHLAPTELLDADRADLVAWQTAQTHLVAGSLNVATSIVVCFYTWAHEEGLTATNVAGRLPRPVVPRRLPRPISEADLALGITLSAQPYRVMLALAAYAGLRCCEISRLSREDIHDEADPPFLHVTGKGSKERAIPLGPVLLAELHAYGLPRAGHVFGRMDGHPGPPSPNRVSQMIATHLDSLGVSATAHRARHRMATVAYRATRDLRAVQTLLGHASPVTTSIYAAFADDALTAAALAADGTASPVAGSVAT